MSTVPTPRAALRRPRALRRSAAVSAIAVAALAAGCGSGPQAARFHSLLPPPGAREAAVPAPREPARGLAWALAPVSVPAGLDRPQWVVRAPDGSLAVLENERWIAPLADDLRAGLAERLAHVLGPEGAVPAAGQPGWRIAVDVRRFESIPARAARIDAGWTVSRSGQGAGRGAPTSCSGSFEQPVEAGYQALAAGHRQALARLAEAVAYTVSALERGEAAACPR